MTLNQVGTSCDNAGLFMEIGGSIGQAKQALDNVGKLDGRDLLSMLADVKICSVKNGLGIAPPSADEVLCLDIARYRSSNRFRKSSCFTLTPSHSIVLPAILNPDV